jgi:hypothetical protein
MIGMKVNGRLGNHLFQYAFILEKSLKFNTSFFMDERITKFLLDEYFELNGYSSFWNRIKRKLFLLLKKDRETVYVNHEFSPSENFNKVLKNNVIYEGFFQSDLYFKDSLSQLKKHFTVKKEHRIITRNMFDMDHRPILAIHIRRTDYVDYGSDRLGGKNMTLPLSYYQNALRTIDTDKYNVLFVSDEIEFVKSNFEMKAYYSESNSMIVDFQLIQSSNLIIVANSSFSWWAAYLSDAERIIAPQYWLGFKVNKEYPHSTIPARWEQQNVY